MDNILEKVQSIFRDSLDQPNLMLTPESNASNVENWDSLAHVVLVMAIERQYKITFALGEMHQLRHVGSMIESIKSKLVAK